MTEVLFVIPGTLEFRLRELEERALAVSLESRIPECPVRDTQIKIRFIKMIRISDLLHQVPKKWSGFQLL